ncbi:MAG: RNA polymerase sigma factor region1.1 domain-containing protein, partial [Pseudomonadota bacterium]
MAKASEKQAAATADQSDRDGPLLDMSDSAVKRFIKAGKARGYVTYEELNTVLPSEEVSSDQIEDLYATLSDMGINVVESEEEGDESEEGGADPVDTTSNSSGGRALATQAGVPSTTPAKSEPSERTDDPVRMYL